MYADQPRSRIAREFFYILNSLKDHYKALLRMRDEDPVLLGRLLTLLAIYMLKEEGMKFFRRQDVIRETQLPRSSVYRIINEFVESGILEEKLGEYKCMSQTPEFIVNPDDLYGRPLAIVKEKDYAVEEQVREALRSFSAKIPEIIREELRKAPTAKVTLPLPSEAVDTEITPIPVPTKQIDLLDQVDDDDDEDVDKTLEEDMEDFLL